MANPLSGRFNFSGVARFAWPTIVMLVFVSMYSMVDGAFVARYVGTDALSAINIVLPAISLFYAIGIMFSSGSGAIVANLMGQRRVREARENFTFMLLISVATGVAYSLAFWLYLEPILRLLGAEGDVIADCAAYVRPLLPFIPASFVQMYCQTYFIAAGRPVLGMLAVVLGGVTNIALDYLFIVVFGMGLGGAALATGIGYAVPAVTGLVFFGFVARGDLRFARPVARAGVLWSSVVNGSSEMVASLSYAVVTYLFNMAMLRLIGLDGIAAITIVLYSEFLLSSIYFGFSSGVAPLFSYQHGKGDAGRLQHLFRHSLLFVGLCSLVAVVLPQLFSSEVVSLFAPADSPVHAYAERGFRIFAVTFLFMGFNVFTSALFTALSNGKISALLSLLRFFCIAASIVVLPDIIGVDGVWLAVPVAEIICLGFSAACVHRYRSVYRYA